MVNKGPARRASHRGMPDIRKAFLQKLRKRLEDVRGAFSMGNDRDRIFYSLGLQRIEKLEAGETVRAYFYELPLKAGSAEKMGIDRFQVVEVTADGQILETSAAWGGEDVSPGSF